MSNSQISTDDEDYLLVNRIKDRTWRMKKIRSRSSSKGNLTGFCKKKLHYDYGFGDDRT